MNHDEAVELLKDYAEKLHHLKNGDVDPRDAEDYIGETYDKLLAALTRPLTPNAPTEPGDYLMTVKGKVYHTGKYWYVSFAGIDINAEQITAHFARIEEES